MQQHESKYLHATSTPGVGSKVKTCFFLKVVMLLTTFIELKHGTSCKHIFCPNTHPQPLGLGQKIKIFCFESTVSGCI